MEGILEFEEQKDPALENDSPKLRKSLIIWVNSIIFCCKNKNFTVVDKMQHGKFLLILDVFCKDFGFEENIQKRL